MTNPVSSSRIILPEGRVVEASAGSGKTYALAVRYLQILLGCVSDAGNVQPRHLLAITFTNQASQEMKERILRLLKALALPGGISAGERESLLAALGRAGADLQPVPQRARDLVDCLVTHYSDFQVQTIDSFINRLLSACAFYLDLSFGFEIREEYRDYLTYGLEAILDRAETGDRQLEAMLVKFLDQHLRVADKPDWLPARDIFALACGLYETHNIYGGQFKRYEREIEVAWSLKEEIYRDVAWLSGQDLPGMHRSFQKGLERFVGELGESFRLGDLPQHFLRAELWWKKNVSPPPPAAVSRWRRIRTNLHELARLEAHAVFNRYLDIYEQAAGEFRAAAVRDNVVFLPELNRKASELLAREGLGPPEIYYRLATRFYHYLVDEFQDTSVLQWHNLQPLIQEALSGAGSLFCVGDRKQAIYGFRGGDDSLLNALVRGEGWPVSVGTVRTDRLSLNYRSPETIVNFNNRVFSPENIRRFLQAAGLDKRVDDPGEVAAVFEGSRQQYCEGRPRGFLRVETVAEDRDGLLTRQKLLDLLEGLTRRFAPGEIAVLLRDNKGVKQVTGWLLERGVPVESEKTLNLRENPLIQELVSFLRFLNSPVDDLAFLAFINGEIFLRATGLKRERVRRLIFQQRSGGDRSAGYLYPEFRRAFPETWNNFLEEFFAHAAFYPLYELVVTVFRRFRVLEHFPGSQGFFMRLLEIIREEEIEHNNPAGFLEYFDTVSEERLYVQVTPGNAIRVMTIHKAKGLEFPVVILPFLSVETTRRSGGGAHRRPVKFDVYPEDGNLRLVKLARRAAAFSPELEELYRQSYRRGLTAELNGIYVALTRAGEELYLLVPARSGRGDNPACHLFSSEAPEQGEPVAARAGESREFLPQPVSPSPYPDWLELLEAEFVSEALVRNRKDVERGEAAHRLLSFMGNLVGADLDSLLEEALAVTGDEYLLSAEERTALAAKIKSVVTAPRFRDIFFPAGETTIYREQELVTASGDVLRIDRLLVSSGTVTVVDFKGSREREDRDRRQVGGYLEQLRDFYPGRSLVGKIAYLNEPGFCLVTL